MIRLAFVSSLIIAVGCGDDAEPLGDPPPIPSRSEPRFSEQSTPSDVPGPIELRVRVDGGSGVAPPRGCASDADCSDAQFCNGREQCRPADPSADAQGCVSADETPCGPSFMCDDVADECMAVACGSDFDCSNGVFCDGMETCDPFDAMADEAGCVPPDAGPCDGGGTCDEVSDSCEFPETCDPGTGFTFAAALTIRVARRSGSFSEGFDLDMMPGGTEDGCFRTDFTRLSDGGMDIDNQNALALSTFESNAGNADTLIAQRTADNTVVVGLEVEAVDDFTNDDCIVVRLSQLSSAMGAVALDGSNRIIPDQVFSTAESIVASSARIVDGGVIARFGSWGFDLPLPGAPAADVSRAELSVDLDSLSGLGSGVLGWSSSVSGWAQQSFMYAPMPGLPSWLSTAAGIADLDFDGKECGEISVAVTFQSATATIN